MNELHEIIYEISMVQWGGLTAFCALCAVCHFTNADERLTSLWARLSARREIRAQERKARRRALYTFHTEHIPGTTGYRIKTR